MIILGLILLILGWLVPQLSVLATIGWILLAVGLILLLLYETGHQVGGRRWY